ncbi:hypothetical protein [Streptomyces sp. NPDC004376]
MNTSERPYTDDDLRTEAARQHATLTEDPDFTGVGEAMEDSYVESTVIDEDPDFQPEGSTWGELLPYNHDDGAAYNQVQRAIHRLISRAADVSQWAVNLGADGLEPEEHSITLGAGKPIARIHFAFEPDMPEGMRTALVEGIGQAIADHL